MKTKKKQKTMFKEIATLFNKNIGKTISKNEVLKHLFKKGFIIKNSDGSYYTGSFNWYRQKFKSSGYIDYDSNEEIEILRKIPLNLRSKDI